MKFKKLSLIFLSLSILIGSFASSSVFNNGFDNVTQVEAVEPTKPIPTPPEPPPVVWGFGVALAKDFDYSSSPTITLCVSTSTSTTATASKSEVLTFSTPSVLYPDLQLMSGQLSTISGSIASMWYQIGTDTTRHSMFMVYPGATPVTISSFASYIFVITSNGGYYINRRVQLTGRNLYYPNLSGSENPSLDLTTSSIVINDAHYVKGSAKAYSNIVDDKLFYKDGKYYQLVRYFAYWNSSFTYLNVSGPGFNYSVSGDTESTFTTLLSDTSKNLLYDGNKWIDYDSSDASSCLVSSADGSILNKKDYSNVSVIKEDGDFDASTLVVDNSKFVLPLSSLTATSSDSSVLAYDSSTSKFSPLKAGNVTVTLSKTVTTCSTGLYASTSDLLKSVTVNVNVVERGTSTFGPIYFDLVTCTIDSIYWVSAISYYSDENATNEEKITIDATEDSKADGYSLILNGSFGCWVPPEGVNYIDVIYSFGGGIMRRGSKTLVSKFALTNFDEKDCFVTYNSSTGMTYKLTKFGAAVEDLSSLYNLYIIRDNTLLETNLVFDSNTSIYSKSITLYRNDQIIIRASSESYTVDDIIPFGDQAMATCMFEVPDEVFVTQDYINDNNRSNDYGMIYVTGTYQLSFIDKRCTVSQTSRVDIDSHNLSLSAAAKFNYHAAALPNTTPVVKVYEDDTKETLIGSYVGTLNNSSSITYQAISGNPADASCYKDTFFVELECVDSSNKHIPCFAETYSLEMYFNNVSSDATVLKYKALCEANYYRLKPSAKTSDYADVSSSKIDSTLNAVASKRKYSVTDKNDDSTLTFSEVTVDINSTSVFAFSFDYLTSFGDITITETVGSESYTQTFNSEEDTTATFTTQPFFYANFADVHTITISSQIGEFESTLKINGYEYIYLGLQQSEDTNVLNSLVYLYDFVSSL